MLNHQGCTQAVDTEVMEQIQGCHLHMQATKTSSIMVMIGQIDNEIKNKIGWVIQQNKLSLKPIKDKKQEPLWDTLSTRRWSNTVTDEVANEARIGKGLDIINPMNRLKAVQKLKTDRLT